MVHPRLSKISFSLPWEIGKVEIVLTDEARRAAWELYVELQTRIAVQPLGVDEGLLREALNSLHTIFATTREVLRESGPVVGAKRNSVGGIAMRVLNQGLRPFLGKWHPELQVWESERRQGTSPRTHEDAWPKGQAARRELDSLRKRLGRYSRALERIAGVGK